MILGDVEAVEMLLTSWLNQGLVVHVTCILSAQVSFFSGEKGGQTLRPAKRATSKRCFHLSILPGRNMG